MSFLSKVQNIEIDYTVDADSHIEPRGDTSSTQSSDDLLKSFWEVLEKLFPNVRRVVLYQTSARNICFKSKGLSVCLLRLWKACPPSVEATAFVAWAAGGPVFRRGRIRANGESMTIERSLYRLSDKGALEKVASRRKYQTVMIPMRTLDGPIGRFEKAKFIDERIQLQRRGLGVTMIEALDRHHFDDGGPGPFDCPMRYCREHFTEPGQWTFHAALEHVNDLIPGRQFDGWPEEFRQMFRRRHIELYRLKEKNDINVKRIQREWDDADDDKRKEIKEAWMEQLSNDPDWDTGVPAEDSSLWKRFESWMQKCNQQQQDPKVAKVEDALLPATKKTLDLSTLKLDEKAHPLRPAFGTRGAKVLLTANYVELIPPSDLVLHQYDLHITPAEKGGKNKRIVQLLLESPELAPYKGDVATDFKSTLVSRTRLGDKSDKEQIDLEIVFRSEGEDEPTTSAATYKVRLQWTKSLSIGKLIDYLNSTNLSDKVENRHEFTQALNIFLNHYAKSANNLATIGSTKTFSLSQNSARADLGSGLEVIRGFFSSVRTATCRILVNVNVSHGAFFQSGPLPGLMGSYGTRNTIALEKFLKSVRVRTTHLPEKKNKAGEVIPRIKTIFGLARKDDGHSLPNRPKVKSHGAGAKDVEFWLEGDGGPSATKAKAKGGRKEGPATGGKYISVYDFFRTTYKRNLQHPELPVVNCGNRKNPMYLPAEVCIVIPGQPSRAKLDSRQTQEMIRHAVRKPWDNAASIVQQGLTTVGLDANSNIFIRSFNLKVTPGLVKIPGRILNGPKVTYKGNKTIETRFGSWNMMNIKFNAGATLQKWSYMMISQGGRDAFDQASLTAVMKEFHQGLSTIGMTAPAPMPGKRVELRYTDGPELDAQLNGASRVGLQLLVIILPEASIPLYKRIKTLADKKHGLHTICCVGQKLAKDRGRDQYIANVALKINLKLGGINQVVEPKNLHVIDQNRTMVVGLDVTHPQPGSTDNAPSVAAMVASTDKFLSQWPAVLRVQEGRQENVDDLGEMLKSRLNLWKTKGKHTALPENILIYRDGVSEGQYDMVIKQELSQLRRACELVYPAPDTKKGLPRFSIIICGKRHKTRFYPTQEQDCDRSGNTKPGTVVDRGVTEARNWDFFLQAHAALQGTARPCHYYIVHDEIFRQIYAKQIPPPFQNIADIVEDLTHNMCYLFGRATKAVSLCPPAYYADLACERARCYLSNFYDTPSPSAAPSVAGSTAAGGTPAGPNLVVVDVKTKGVLLLEEQRQVTYTALSYTWGTGPFSHETTINGVPWRIKESLSDFLHQYRSDQSLEKESYIWIDAVVNNQADDDEKSHQVANMRDIYEKAYHVQVWLGKAATHTEQAVQFLHRLLAETNSKNADISDSALDGLRDLYTRPWPTRMWIRQKVWAAKAISIQCGSSVLPLDVFKAGVVYSNQAGHNADEGGSEVSDSSDLGIYSSPRALGWLHKKLKIAETQLAAISFLTQKLVGQQSPEDRALSGLGHKAMEGDGRKDILWLLYESVNYESTDVRDRIYALIGMCDNPDIEVDYHLPSWVPDWRTLSLIRYEPQYVTKFDMNNAFDSNRPRALMLHGFLLGKVEVAKAKKKRKPDILVHLDWTRIQDKLRGPNLSPGFLAKPAREDTITFGYTRKEIKLGDSLIVACGSDELLLLRSNPESEDETYEFVTSDLMSRDKRKELRGSFLEYGAENGLLETFTVV
ncbi:hypothetical protein SLS60_006489 [Paraconiothyrium brasiliense]|uniref:C2H2-type domain-containing protein n=1 Tax=Paraconiothyrium brasiliense TaxID=300254 RepID=A0ABR3RBT4_9PLEO